VPGPALMATKARPRMRAALVTRRPVRPMPSTTAVSVEPVRSEASRMRLMMKTWYETEFLFGFDVILDRLEQLLGER
jgi:hypothetical protein